jgi:hypothetical protein
MFKLILAQNLALLALVHNSTLINVMREYESHTLLKVNVLIHLELDLIVDCSNSNCKRRVLEHKPASTSLRRIKIHFCLIGLLKLNI